MRGKVVGSYQPPSEEFSVWPDGTGYVVVAPSGARLTRHPDLASAQAERERKQSEWDRVPSRGPLGTRVALASDWQWGDRYLRAGLHGTVLGREAFGRLRVMLDCFTDDSSPQLIPEEQLGPADTTGPNEPRTGG